MQPIEFYVAPSGPNPWKVAIILNELELPYNINNVPYTELKGPDYVKVNPNGRVPAIKDPNTGITLWESGAIIEYLVNEYDKTKKLTYDSFPQNYLLKQYLFFQMSGQGPYYGQAAWFTMGFHPEDLPSARERYQNEVKRVHMVLEDALTRNGTGWLVGDKCTYADLAFVVWDKMSHDFMAGNIDVAEYPKFKVWHEAMMERPSVKKAFETREGLVKAMSQGH